MHKIININQYMKNLMMVCLLHGVLSGMVTAMQEKNDINSAPINLIFGLDETLIGFESEKIEEVHQFFSKKSFLIQDSFGNNYIVPAYCAQFFKYIVRKFSMTFFCTLLTVDRDRDNKSISIIDTIWHYVFGTPKPDNVRLLFESDMTYLDCDNEEEFQPYFGDDKYWWGGGKKDITKVGTLDNTILIDYEYGHVLKGQEYNLLRVQPTCNFYDLQRLIEYHRDNATHADERKQDIQGRLVDTLYGPYLLAFYKLPYIVGVLEAAAQHETGIIDGLRAIQFKDGMPQHDETCIDMRYYKSGYDILLTLSLQEQRETILYLLQSHQEDNLFVFPYEIRKIIAEYIIEAVKQSMCLFPEIEKYFFS
jgi:hypothetical protein